MLIDDKAQYFGRRYSRCVIFLVTTVHSNLERMCFRLGFCAESFASRMCVQRTSLNYMAVVTFRFG